MAELIVPAYLRDGQTAIGFGRETDLLPADAGVTCRGCLGRYARSEQTGTGCQHHEQLCQPLRGRSVLFHPIEL